MTTADIGRIAQAGISGIVNIATVKAVTDTANRGLRKSSAPRKSKSKKMDIW